MSQLLVSVRDAREAKLVSDYDIGILDVKEPDRGGLGASDPATLSEVANSVSGSIVKSFSAGELVDWSNSPLESEDPLRDRYNSYDLEKYHYVKVGLANVDKTFSAENSWSASWQRLFQGFSRDNGPRSVGVVYVDYSSCGAPEPDALLELFASVPHCEAILFDTFNKAQRLFDYIAVQELDRLVRLSREAGLKTVVAGSVTLDLLPDVQSLRPDFVGVRGAVCTGGRSGKIEGSLVNGFLSRMRHSSDPNSGF